MRNNFSYNRVFIPEFFSTVIISIIVTLITGFWFSSTVNQASSIHKTPSIVLYTLLVIFAVFISIYFRRKYSYFVLDSKGFERKGSWYSAPFVGFDEIQKIRESRGEFFGKESRYLNIELKNNEVIKIYDYVFGYDQLRALIEKQRKKKISQDAFLTHGHVHNFANENHDTLAQKLLQKSNIRDKVFGNPNNFYDSIVELGRRILCLLPVCITDFYLKIMIDTIFGKNKEQPTPLSYYSSFISLLVSIMVARYVYFNLFSYEKGLRYHLKAKRK
ncbi:hypothetical protein [Candidatus Uabimicrobium sp. HlEnr_7]|uniref:hypothetical protein n=1 Tax=Candidatus Uabimicrobium helgolandensis TaxID=3095367 RepID=UPI0035574786